MIYLNLASTDSLSSHPENVWHDFIIELPQPLIGTFRCALLEFYSELAMSEDIYVFSDICEPQFVHDSTQPLLRIVSDAGEVSIPHFKLVSREVVQRIRIYLRDHNFEIPSQNIGNVRITLELESI